MGILNLDGAPVDRALLERMTQALAFRGPDEQRTWCGENVGLGHAMLRTTRESLHEHQPFQSAGGSWIIADARVDARAELINKLNADPSDNRNVSLATPDVELILAAYERWGDACVDHLLGDFAFAIWDARERRLFCARDQFGVKPFNYARIGNTLVFSNTIRVLFLYPGITMQPSDAAIGDYLLFGLNLNSARSPFENILPIPPAHSMSVIGDSIHVARYWSMPIEEPLRYRRSREYVEEYQGLLKAAVGDRLRTDRVSVTLSGGLDSPTVAAVALENLGAPEKMLALTSGYDRAIPDPEPGLAKTIAEYLGISHQYFAIDNSEPFEPRNLRKIRISWPYYLLVMSTYCKLYGAAARHSRVLLTGEGGDAGFVPSLGVHGGLRLFPLAWNIGKFMLTRGRHPRIGFRIAWLRWRGMPVEPPPEYPDWIRPEFESSARLKERWLQLSKNPASEHPFRPDSYTSLAFEHWPYLFELSDPGSTQLPVELRHPLFDIRLQRFFLRLPILPWTADKELVRMAMRGRLPEVILRRPKSPVVGDPTSQMLRETDPALLNNFSPAPEFERYVVREKIPVMGGEAQVSNPELQLRALDLNYWLRSLS